MPVRPATEDVARLRLVAHGLVAGSSDPASAVRRMLAVQAQEAVAPLAAVALRTAGRPRRGAIEAAFADGHLVRSWSQRGTLHVLAPEDLPWLLQVTAPRMTAATRTVRAREGVTDAVVARAAAVVAEVVPAGGLRRPDLLARFADAGLDVSGNRGYHLLIALAVSRVLVVGERDTQYRFHRWADRVPASPLLDRDEALARLATRYAEGHGPVGDRDLAFWAGITVTDARRALAAADLVELEGPGGPLRAAPALLDTALPPGPVVGALPPFDELVIGYADRRAVLGAHPLEAVAPGANGRFLPTVHVDGRLVGTWSAGPPPGVALLEPVPPAVAWRIDAVVADQAGWSGR